MTLSDVSSPGRAWPGPLDRFQADQRPGLERALARAVAPLPGPVGAVSRYAIGAGGKRIRPLLAIAAYRTLAEDGEAPDEPIHDLAAAIELVHTYSLLHDDLPCMDDDGLRRGLPTAHRVYGIAAATAAGLALQGAAFASLGRAVEGEPAWAASLGRIVRRLATAAGVEGMVGGQYLDLEAESRPVDGPWVEAIHRSKTAALVAAAAAVGAIAADVDEEAVDRMAEYGTELGLAFQIVDDLLDVTGEMDRIGKATGADAARAKATYPAVHGVEAARAHAAEAGARARRAVTGLSAPTGLLEAFVDLVLDRLE